MLERRDDYAAVLVVYAECGTGGQLQEKCKELGVEMYEVDRIEVLDEGSRGLFGLGARDVRVKVSVERLPDRGIQLLDARGRSDDADVRNWLATALVIIGVDVDNVLCLNSSL